jgi:diguanylate cyclase (GGDEF)-like protein
MAALQSQFSALTPEQLAGLDREHLLQHAMAAQAELSAINEALETERITDGLTGLANRDYFLASLVRLCCRAKRFQQVVCVALIDIDNFRSVNEQYGTMSGDLVLTGLADVLRAVVRNYDLLARFGEDEFAIAIDNADANVARQLGQRIRSAVAANPFCVSDRVIPLTVTVGVVSSPAEQLGDRPDELIRAAIEAVEAAASKGRNQWHYMDLSSAGAGAGMAGKGH